MTCHYRNASSDELLSCMGLTPIYSESEVSSYVQENTDNPNVYHFVIACLRVNRMIRPDVPEGTCNRLHAVPTTEQQVFSGISRVAVDDPEPISRAILGGIGKLGSFFSNLFSGAPSLRELQTDCLVVQSYNSFADAMENHLQKGNIQLPDAIAQLGSVTSQLQSQLQTLEGYDKPEWAPYFHRKALDALKTFNDNVVYPKLASGIFSFLPAPVAGFLNEAGGIVSDDVKLITGGRIILSTGIAFFVGLIVILLGVKLLKGVRVQRVTA